jgi:hypothetical protein
MAWQPVSALASGDVTNDRATLDFPNTITFHVEIASQVRVTSLALEYGDQEQTCGQVVARAYPQFTPGKSITADWTWDMRQAGSLPPGAQIWWRWRYTDEAGNETITDQRSITWLDKVHNWQTKTEGDIHLHWYQNGQAFGQDLLDTAYNGLARVETEAGLATDQPIDLYIYADTSDMQDAILYEPSWTGGEAFPEHNIVIIGIAASELSWGRRAEVHELTHVLVGHLTFTCLGGVPTWLNEGLAVFSEGALDSSSQQQLNDAIRNDTLLTVRSLSGEFSEVPDKAYLSYSESYSIVNFLLQTYGRGKMTSLLIALRDGNTPDAALTAVYGFNIEGLEDAWRTSIGGRSRPAAVQPTSMPSPTAVPTIVPFSGMTLAIAPTSSILTTPAAGNAAHGSPPLSLTLMLAFSCCAIGLVVGVLVVAFVLALQNQKRGKHDKLA